MEWIGIFTLIIMVCYISYPDKVRRTEHKVRCLEKKLNGGTDKMSKLILELIGKKCVIKFSESFESFYDGKVVCTINEADEDWIKISYDRKKKKGTSEIVNKIVRIENIESIEFSE